jgi:hemerythrin-like domain-containing protein
MGSIAEELLMSGQKIHAQRPRRAALAHLGTLEVLHRTHGETVEILARLQILIETLEVRGIDEGVRELAQDICRFFDQTARPHHVAEEEFVFPDLLASADPELVQHVKRLQQDHGWLEENWLEMAPHLRAVSNGQSWYDIDILRSAVPTFTELYRDHIELEETVVYPASRRYQRTDLLRNASSGN